MKTKITTNYRQETKKFIDEVEAFLESTRSKNCDHISSDVATKKLLEEAKNIQKKLAHMQTYTLDVPAHLSKPGSIIVYHEIIEPFLQAKGPNKLVEIASLDEHPFTLSDSDITVDASTKFLFLERGQNFFINNKTIAICRNVLSKEGIIDIITEPDQTKVESEVNEEDRVIIETPEDYRYLVASRESGLIGTKIGEATSYNSEKVKVIGSITRPTFETRILS